MSSDCVHQFAKNICLPFQSTWDHPRFLVRFILNCVMFRSSCLSFCSFSFGIFLSFILRLMVSLFKKNNMYNVQEYNILYNNDVPSL